MRVFGKSNKDSLSPAGHDVLAQSATELAIFGSILIFVIGLIVRTGLYQGLAINNQLRAMRVALSESYKTAHGYYRHGADEGKPAGARNTASVLMIEDRLSVDSAQALGTTDRIPLISSGGGTFSHNLFWSLDYGNEDDLPMFDVIANGQRIPLTTGRFMYATITNGRTLHFFYSNNGQPKYCDGTPCAAVSPPTCTMPNNGFLCVEPTCISDSVQACIVAFKKIYNVPPPAGEEWCYSPCPGTTAAGIAERFDLDHDGHTDVPRPDYMTLINGDPLRLKFNWQWGRVLLTPTKRDIGDKLRVTYADGISIKHDINTSVDLDGDGDLEYILDVQQSGGRIVTIQYVDYQEGDINLGEEGVGLQKDVQMFSRTNAPLISGTKLYGGTYMLIDEGKLFGPSGQFIRDTTKQDHIDLITRFFQLSNNTGRFCDSNLAPVVWNVSAAVQGVKHLKNPVEACGVMPGLTPADCGTDQARGVISTCNSAINIEKTCFDTTCNMLYIRSRIDNLKGDKWINRVFK